MLIVRAHPNVGCVQARLGPLQRVPQPVRTEQVKGGVHGCLASGCRPSVQPPDTHTFKKLAHRLRVIASVLQAASSQFGATREAPLSLVGACESVSASPSNLRTRNATAEKRETAAQLHKYLSLNYADFHSAAAPSIRQNNKR